MGPIGSARCFIGTNCLSALLVLKQPARSGVRFVQIASVRYGIKRIGRLRCLIETWYATELIQLGSVFCRGGTIEVVRHSIGTVQDSSLVRMAWIGKLLARNGMLFGSGDYWACALLDQYDSDPVSYTCC